VFSICLPETTTPDCALIEKGHKKMNARRKMLIV
jgi:hypothetical protein